MANRQPRGRELQLLRSFGAADGREEALRRKIDAEVEVDRRSHLEISPWLDCDRLEDRGLDPDPELVAAAASRRLIGPPQPDYGAISNGGVSLVADLSSGGEQQSPRPVAQHPQPARSGCSTSRVLVVLALAGALLLAVGLLGGPTARSRSFRSS